MQRQDISLRNEPQNRVIGGGAARRPARGRRARVFAAAVAEAMEPRVLLSTVTVSTSADAGPNTLRAALANAAPGDMIDFAPSIREINLTSAGLTIAQNVTIVNDQGTGPVLVNGDTQFTVFTVNYGVTASITGLTVSGGGGTTYAGGILNSGTLSLNNDTVSSNTGAAGGGITNLQFGTLTLTNDTISGNSAATGGGIFQDGSAILTNDTIAINSATGGDGGGIWNGSGGNATLTNVTVSDNTAFDGAGIYNNQFGGGTLALTDTIDAANITTGTDPDIDGPVTSTSSYNLIGDGTGLSGLAIPDTNHNLIGAGGNPVKAMLAPLGDNGGPTETFALLPGSPAIDAGVIVPGVTTDQRGLPRPAGNGPDIGAFELQNSTVATKTSLAATTTTPTYGETVVFIATVTANGQPVSGGSVTFEDGSSVLGNAPVDTTGQAMFPYSALSAGNHTITAVSNLSSGYATSSGTVTEDVAQLPISVEANVESKRVGTSDPSFQITITSGSLLPGDHFTGTLSRAPGETVGSYSIVQNTFTAGPNYAINFTDGLLHIVATPAVVTTWSQVKNKTPFDVTGVTTAPSPTSSSPAITAQSTGFTGETTVTAFSSSPVDPTSTPTSTYYDLNVQPDPGSVTPSSQVTATVTNQQPNETVMYWNGSHWVLVKDASGKPVTTNSTGTASWSIVENRASDPNLDGLNQTFIQVGIAEAPSLTVTTASDVVDALDGLTSLREAIAYDNRLPTPMPITFAPTVFNKAQTITLLPAQGSLMLSNTAGTIALEGPSAGLTINGGGNVTDFTVNAGVSASISGLTITGGNALLGGGIQDAGTLLLTNDTLSGNSATDGGGIYLEPGLSLATLNNTTLSGNSATMDGGGIDDGGSGATLINCTLFNNSASLGGGINSFNQAGLRLTNDTVSGNSAGQGGGIAVQSGVTLANTIVAGNMITSGGSDPDVYGFVNNNGGHNLIGDGTGISDGSGTPDGVFNNDLYGDQVGTAAQPIYPMLAMLAYNGGPTQTIALLPGSPAIDKGSNALAVDANGIPLAYDQRGPGDPRISGGTVDIGAYEFQPPAVVGSPVINGDNPNGLYNAAGQPSAGAQRSIVEDVVYTFNEPVTIANANAAFTVVGTGPNPGIAPTTLIATAVPGSNGTQWAVTLTGSAAGVLGSIANGEYSITINPSAVFSATDGATALTAGRTDQFYRLYGDINGDETVNAADNLQLKKALTTYNPAFDFNADGTVNAADNLAFKKDLTAGLFGDGFVPTL